MLKPPDFIIIGAMRAGTTSLAERLARHPEIGMSRLKETDFFIEEKNFSRGYKWYQSLFPCGKRILGEASPNYTKGDVFKGVPARIRAMRPDVKLIYVVRDPVDRFCSHYTHSCLVHGGLSAPDEIFNEREGAHVLASSMYYRQVSAFLEVFSRSQLKIIDFDDFVSSPDTILADICTFLGVDSTREFAWAEKTNSAEALAMTPTWALRISQHQAITGLKAAMPASLRSSMKHMLSRAFDAQRETPPIPQDTRERVRDAVADDANRFRTLTGRAFANWSV